MINFKNIDSKSSSKEFDLNSFSFSFLLLADLFIAVIIFYGLSQQIDQLADEYEYFPSKYREIYIHKSWVENNILEKITSSVLSINRQMKEDRKDYKKMHPVCQITEDHFTKLSESTSTLKLFEKRERLRRRYKNYDSFQKTKSPEAAWLLNEIKAIDSELRSQKGVKETISYIFAIQVNQGHKFSKEIKNYRKLFALKRTGLVFIFLLPIALFLIWWNRRSQRREKYLSVIISSHLLLISFLPIGFESIRLIIEVIPKVLLKTIYEALKSLNLISFWYYGVILVSIVLTSYVLWLLHTKVFTQKRYILQRIHNNLCSACSRRVDYSKGYCPYCGNNHLNVCDKCKEKTIKGLDFCQNCGSKI